MNHARYFFVISLIICGVFLMGTAGNDEEKKITYPETLKKVVIDDYDGIKVSDPYRWLEEFDNKDVQEWTKAQNAVTRSILDSMPYRGKLIKRLVELYEYPREYIPTKKGDYYFFSANTGLQPQNILYRKKGLDGKPELVIDPANLGKHETAAMNWYYPSSDGKFLAYGISTFGDEQAVLYVKDLTTGKDLSEEIPGCRMAGVSWLKDNSGFYYSRFPDPKTVEKGKENFFHKLFFHRIGTDYKDDELIFEVPDKPDYLIFAQLSDDERYLIIYGAVGTRRENELFVYDRIEKGKVRPLFTGFDAQYNIISYKDKTFLRTSKDAPMYRLVRLDIDNPGVENWVPILPEKEGPLGSVDIVNDKIVASYLFDAHSVMFIYDLDGKLLKEIKTPVLGVISGLSSESDSKELFFSFSSFTYPSTIFRVDMDTLEKKEIHRDPVKVDTDSYTVEQVFFKSKDGTRVPMFLAYKKGMKRDGTNPTVLTAYGGFNIPIIPDFRSSRYVILENGGLIASANIRGGGEYGVNWHQSAILDKRQNAYDDFIAAAEYLIKEKWTSSEKLCIQGGSNGGLLTGVAMVQRPDLFKAVVSQVPLLDMLRYHKFSIGRYWVSEFGSADNPEQFEFLKSYSPYHNVDTKVEYPALFLTAGASDSRVVPLHAMKFAAMLQNDTNTTEPVLLWVEYESGHGQGKPLMKSIEASADLYSFIFWQLGMNVK